MNGGLVGASIAENDGRRAAEHTGNGLPGDASVGVVDRERRVVGEARLAQDRTALQAIAQRRRHELVIDAPTDVVGARRATVAPPGVVLAFRVERAVGVDPPAHARGRAVASAVVADPAVEPGALGRDRKSTRTPG